MLSPPADYNGTMNVLHRRKQQLDNWESSETNKIELIEHEPEKVNFSDSVKFWAACSHRDIPEIKRFLEKNVDVNVAKVDGLTALHQACIDNAYEIVEFLLDNGADPNIQDNEGWTPLHATSSCDYGEIARLLIERNASTGITSYDNELPVDIATNKQMKDILREAMLKQGVDESEARDYEHTALLKDSKAWLENPSEYPKVTDPKSGASPIHVASAKDYVDVLKILIQIPDIDVNVQDIDGWTPLHAAAHWGQEESLRLLVGAGASFDILTFANQSVTDVSMSNLTMTIRQLREQRRLYNLSVGKKETTSDSKCHAGKKESSEETVDKEKHMDSHQDEKSDKATDNIDDNQLHNEPINDSSNGKENEDVTKTTPANSYEPVNTKTDPVDLTSTTKKPLADLDERVRMRGQSKETDSKEGDGDKLLKDISNVRKDKSLSSASSTSSTSSSSSSTRRVSAVMAPAKAEETETQRSIRARHVRSTRRSTQGITNETLEEARRLTQEDSGSGEIAEADSSTNPANANEEKKNPDEADDAPPLRSWRDRICMNTATSADSTTDTASTTSSNNSSANKISLRRQTRDRVPTGKVNQADLDAAKEQIKESSAQSTLGSSRQNSSSDDPVTAASTGRPQTRYTSRYTALNGTSSANSSSIPTTTPTSPIGSGYGKANDSRSTSTHTNSSSGYTSVRNSPSRSGNISALSTSGTPPPQSSWRDSSNLDYRRLYEEERAEKDRLKRQLESLNRQISDLNSELNRLQLQNNFSSDLSTRNRSYQTDDNFKELTTLREQNARMKEENGALIRVISKLSRPT